MVSDQYATGVTSVAYTLSAYHSSIVVVEVSMHVLDGGSPSAFEGAAELVIFLNKQQFATSANGRQ